MAAKAAPGSSAVGSTSPVSQPRDRRGYARAAVLPPRKAWFSMRVPAPAFEGVSDQERTLQRQVATLKAQLKEKTAEAQRLNDRIQQMRKVVLAESLCGLSKFYRFAPAGPTSASSRPQAGGVAAEVSAADSLAEGQQGFFEVLSEANMDAFAHNIQVLAEAPERRHHSHHPHHHATSPSRHAGGEQPLSPPTLSSFRRQATMPCEALSPPLSPHGGVGVCGGGGGGGGSAGGCLSPKCGAPFLNEPFSMCVPQSAGGRAAAKPAGGGVPPAPDTRVARAARQRSASGKRGPNALGLLSLADLVYFLQDWNTRLLEKLSEITSSLVEADYERAALRNLFADEYSSDVAAEKEQARKQSHSVNRILSETVELLSQRARQAVSKLAFHEVAAAARDEAHTTPASPTISTVTPRTAARQTTIPSPTARRMQANGSERGFLTLRESLTARETHHATSSAAQPARAMASRGKARCSSASRGGNEADGTVSAEALLSELNYIVADAGLPITPKRGEFQPGAKTPPPPATAASIAKEPRTSTGSSRAKCTRPKTTHARERSGSGSGIGGVRNTAHTRSPSNLLVNR